MSTRKKMGIAKAHTRKATPTSGPPREVMNENEAADYLRVSPYTLRKWRNAKPKVGPPFVRLGNRIVYRKADIDAHLKSQ